MPHFLHCRDMQNSFLLIPFQQNIKRHYYLINNSLNDNLLIKTLSVILSVNKNYSVNAKKDKKQNKLCHLNFSDCVKEILYECNEVICLIEVVSKWRLYLQF